MSVCSPSYFPSNRCCFVCASFHLPVLPFPPALSSFPHTSRFVPHFPFQNPVTCPLQVPLSAYFLLHPSTFSSRVLLPFPLVLPYPVLPMIASHFPSQNLVEHAWSRSSSSVLPSLYCGFYWLVDFTSIVSVMCFSFLCFTGAFLKSVFIDNFFYFIWFFFF